MKSDVGTRLFAAIRARPTLGVLVAIIATILVIAISCAPGRIFRTEIALTYNPVAGARDVNPTAPVSVSTNTGKLDGVALMNVTSAKSVASGLSEDGRTFSTTEPLGYNTIYEWSGRVVDGDHTAEVRGSFTTLAPDSTIGVRTHIADGAEVGIAAPIVVQFSGIVEDKATVERALVVRTDPPTEGSWAWMPDGLGSRVHWRPREYWKPGTTASVEATLYGLNFGAKAYGEFDLSLHFTIGRSQIVKADATSHRMKVIRDGQTIMNFAVSYGEANEPRNTTRSGIHVVTEKYKSFRMSNPPFYENVLEKNAVRISNNGEFIHENPESVGAQGASNVTNGCINLNEADAAQYFESAMYGDPVEVTGTPIEISQADGYLWDWGLDWETWRSMSAL